MRSQHALQSSPVKWPQYHSYKVVPYLLGDGPNTKKKEETIWLFSVTALLSGSSGSQFPVFHHIFHPSLRKKQTWFLMNSCSALASIVFQSSSRHMFIPLVWFSPPGGIWLYLFFKNHYLARPTSQVLHWKLGAIGCQPCQDYCRQQRQSRSPSLGADTRTSPSRPCRIPTQTLWEAVAVASSFVIEKTESQRSRRKLKRSSEALGPFQVPCKWEWQTAPWFESTVLIWI